MEASSLTACNSPLLLVPPLLLQSGLLVHPSRRRVVGSKEARIGFVLLFPLLLTSPPPAAATPATAPSRSSATPNESPGDPKYLPLPGDLADPAEQKAFADMLAALAKLGSADQDKALAAFDQALRQFGRPTEMRGMIQLSRAQLLLDKNEHDRAIDAIEESIRLLPESSAPLIAAAQVYTYSNQPGRGADYLLRAIKLDPLSVRQIDDYEIQNLIKRLKAAADEPRADLISERLLEIGWAGKTLGARSTLAVGAIRRRVEQGQFEEARALIPYLLDPGDSISLLTMYSFRPLWPDVELWAGPRLEKQWAIYLREAKARWEASKSLDEVGDYVRALVAARHFDTLFAEILPLVRDTDPVRRSDLQFVISRVADSLALVGRPEDGFRLYDTAARIWPLGKDANALNIHANRARFLLENGRAAEAVALFEKVVQDARRWGPEINIDGLAAMHHHRACALHAVGRKASAAASIALATTYERPATVASLHLCLDDPAAAKKVLLEALKDEGSRSHVVSYFQLTTDWPRQSDYGKRRAAKLQQLKSDPELLAAIAPYGRILPFRFADGAPTERVRGSDGK